MSDESFELGTNARAKPKAAKKKRSFARELHDLQGRVNTAAGLLRRVKGDVSPVTAQELIAVALEVLQGE